MRQMSERRSLAWAGGVSPAVGTYARGIGGFLLCLAIASAAAIAFARVIDIPAQPVSPFADTEVVTNVVIHANRTDVRDVEIRLQLAGTAYNDLEVGFGMDVNTNGVLDAEETETVYGWRAGRCVVESVSGWERIETPCATNAASCVMCVRIENVDDSAHRRFSAACNGEPAFLGLATAIPAPQWLYRREWNLMRVTRRGAGTPSEHVCCKVEYPFLYISVR